MSILKKLFSPKEKRIESYKDFWNWFEANEKEFFNVVKNNENIEKGFFKKLSPKLGELKEGIFYLTGMLDENTAELILTPDGIIKNIVFVEELVNAAPNIQGWTFTALKPPSDIRNIRLEMAGYTFGNDTLSFYSNDHTAYPDEINLTIVHKDFNQQNESAITNGTLIFLDNYIGELNSVTNLDNVTVIGKENAERELVPIEKLKDFLQWREKEFIEKYEGTYQQTESDEYSLFKANMNNGKELIATINTDLLKWDKKASHPWLAILEIPFNGNPNNGMPDNATYQLLNEVEDKAIEQLKDTDGYLNIGRQTADNLRVVFFACKDFRKPSKVLYQLTKDYPNLTINYDIYKDKYWRSFDTFNTN